MATRRMFSRTITDSARFLKMPLSTQALYFHLGQHADDDGIVEAFQVLRTIGATEDEIKILVAKGFVTVLNEDLVSYINDWKENNKIRPDRKVDSIYKDLLLQMLPYEQLISPTPRADTGKPTKIGRPVDDQPQSSGQPMDGIGKYSIGKDSVVKVSKVKDSVVKDKYSESVLLTKDQYNSLIENYGEEKTKGCIEILNNYLCATGKKYKSHYHVILNWVHKRYDEEHKHDKPKEAIEVWG